MNWKTPAALAAISTAAVLPGGAFAQDYRDYGTARDWAISALSRDGNFMNCEAMKDDIVFLLHYSSEGWMVSVDAVEGNPSEAPGHLEIDRASFPVTFYQLESGRYGAFLDPGMAAALRDGSFLSAEVAGKPMGQGGLDGSAAAMGKLEECVGNGGVPQQAAASPAVAESDAERMDGTCPDPAQYRSPPSQQPAKITFTNQSDMAVSIYWIDFNGALVEYAGTLPGETVTLDSYDGHNWIAKDFNGTCHTAVLTAYQGGSAYAVW